MGNPTLLLAGSDRLFGLDPQLLVDAGIVAINIFFLFTFLSYLLFNPVKDLLKKRQERIENDRETAYREKEEAYDLRKEYEKKLDKIDKKAEFILSEARKKAMKNEERIIAEAKAEAARIIERANAEITLEKKKATDDIKKEIISVATLMANKVVAVSIDSNMQDRLIDETLGEIGESTWLN